MAIDELQLTHWSDKTVSVDAPRRRRAPRRTRLLTALAIALALIATPTLTATAHNAPPVSSEWPVWQGYRSANTFTGTAHHGYAGAETRRLYNPYGGNYFAFSYVNVADYSQNGSNDCTELWVDFNRQSDLVGSHRNPSVFRYCNNGAIWAPYTHHGLVDHGYQSPDYVGWDITVCRAIRNTSTNQWVRRDCTNELGHKPMHWVESENAYQGTWTGTAWTGRTDAEIGTCTASTGSQSGHGCRIYLHVL